MNPTDEPGVIVISPKVEWLVGAVETAVVWLVMVGDHLL